MVYHSTKCVADILLGYITFYSENMSTDERILNTKMSLSYSSFNSFFFFLSSSQHHSGKQEQEVARAVHQPERGYVKQLRQLAQEAVHPVSVCL